MNDLSWFIYFADVIPTISLGIGLSSCILLVLYVIMFLACAADEELENIPKIVHKGAIIVLALFVFNFSLPSKQAMYLIAASEVGEEVLKTPEATKSLKLINNWLDEQLEKDAAVKTTN